MARDDAPRAFAAAMVAGGIEFVTAFPGSPTTRLAQYFEREAAALGVEFRWAINENVALSQAFGAAMAGRGAAALMKHVGVNVASDALHAMGVVHGLAAPLLLIEGADAKPGSSQSAQDNRSMYASSPQLIVAGPSTLDQIAQLVADACTISALAGMLVVVRGDARSFAATASEDPGEPTPTRERPHPRWPGRGFALSTSARTYAWHLERRRDVLARLLPWFEAQHVGFGLDGELHLAVVVAAHLGAPVAAAVRKRSLPGLRLGLEHPLPEATLLAIASRAQQLVVLEECTPTLELAVRALVHDAGLRTKVIGRAALGDRRPVGRLEGEALDKLLTALERHCPPGRRARSSAEVPADRVDPAPLLRDFPDALERERLRLDAAHPASGFPRGDPRRALFPALRALAAETFIVTDPGVTGVLALADHQCDVKMHMGGAVPIAAGWSRAHVRSLAIAVVGDTNLPHSEWLGLLDAIHYNDDLLVVIVDNGASEMTQHIVTPRLSPTAARASLEAAGMPCQVATLTTDPADWWATTLREAALRRGPRLVWLVL